MDAITGQTGVLLSQNMFVYCLNNPINMSDPNGFMALDTDGEGRTAVHYTKKNSTIKSNIINSVKGVATTIGDSVINKLQDVPQVIKYVANRQAARAGSYIAIPVTGGKLLSDIGKLGEISKVGIIGGITEGICIWDNFSHYAHPVIRTGIEAAGILLGIGAIAVAGAAATAFALPALATVGVGAAIGAGVLATYEEDKWYGQKK